MTSGVALSVNKKLLYSIPIVMTYFVWLIQLSSFIVAWTTLYFVVLLPVNILIFRIFFALASPVFHAMFYGSLKEEGDVEVNDVSIAAFRCLQKCGVIILC